MNKKLIFTLVNAFLFISTIIVTYITLTRGTVAGQVDTGEQVGWFYIVTFTVESNILLGLVAGAATFFGVRSLLKRRPLPKALNTWYLIAASSAMLTCLTVVFFLAPIRAMRGRNYFDMLIGPMFFFHFFNPILAAITLIFFTDKPKLTLKSRLLSILPPAIYAIPYIINVVILENWPDFYGLTFGGQLIFLPLVFIVFCLIVFAISSALSYCHNHKIALK